MKIALVAAATVFICTVLTMTTLLYINRTVTYPPVVNHPYYHCPGHTFAGCWKRDNPNG